MQHWVALAQAAFAALALSFLTACGAQTAFESINKIPSGLYGRAYYIPLGTTQESFSLGLSSGRAFNIESPDRTSLVATVVVREGGYYRVDLPPGNYFIDTGAPDSLTGVVQIPGRLYVRMDLVLKH